MHSNQYSVSKSITDFLHLTAADIAAKVFDFCLCVCVCECYMHLLCNCCFFKIISVDLSSVICHEVQKIKKKIHSKF
jgi:hypothetical protein